MNAPIYYIGGSKGGVGKSIVAWAMLDYVLEQGQKVLLLDSDTSNADVSKAYKKHENDKLICLHPDLDTTDGWIMLINAADKYADHTIVINSAARSNSGVAKYGTTLREALPELDRTLTTFWVINRQRDSLELMRSFLDVFPGGTFHVCRNTYFGAPEKFEIYNSSQIKNLVEMFGKTLDFPSLADRVADKLYSDRIPIHIAIKEMSLGDRAELRRWRTACAEMFNSVLITEISDNA